MSIDFLAGVAIFTLSFIFVFTFIPGMFTPFQSNSDKLTMTADRVSTTLVENFLVVSDSADSYYNRPNVINVQKLSTTDFTSATVRDSVGLGSNSNLHVTLIVPGPKTIDYPPITVQKNPTGALNVGQSKRIVVAANTYTDSSTGAPITITRGDVCILTVTVW
jgi:hypothetical protein